MGTCSVVCEAENLCLVHCPRLPYVPCRPSGDFEDYFDLEFCAEITGPGAGGGN